MNSTTAAHESVWFDQSRALAAAGGDVAVLREIAALFLEDVPQRIGDLHEALAVQDHERLAHQAHSIRGSAVVFGSEATAQAALRLELLAVQRRSEAVPGAVAELGDALGKLMEALQDFLSEQGDPPLASSASARPDDRRGT